MRMRKSLPLLAICLGYFMVILDATIVNVALSSIGRDLGGSVSELQWIIDAYTVVFAGLLLSAGSLADKFGARRLFVTGLTVFTVGSATCGLAPGVLALIAARAVQGIGAAALVPSSLSLLRGIYVERDVRARAIGAWGAMAGVGAASGPVLGGVLVAALGWRAVFAVNVPVGLAALALTARLLPAAGEKTRGGLDPAGQLLGIVVLILLTVGLIEGGAAGWGSPATLMPLAAVLPGAAAFLASERRTVDAMLPMSLFRRATFSGGNFVGLMINLGFYGQLFAISLYFQRVRGFSALQTGLALLPEGVVVAIASLLSGRITARTGPRQPMLVGLTCGAAGLAGLLAAGQATSYWRLVPALAAAGFGMALTMPALTAAVLEAAPAYRAGVAAGVLNAARQAGGAIGVALLGTLLAGAPLLRGVHRAMAVSAGAFLLAAIVTGFTVSRPRGRTQPGRCHHGEKHEYWWTWIWIRCRPRRDPRRGAAPARSQRTGCPGPDGSRPAA